VGTGFTDRMLDDLMDRMKPLQRKDPPIDDPELRKVKGVRFVEPELVCEVEFLQMTSAGKLRAPSYKGLRPDKSPEDCVLERPAAAGEGGEADPAKGAQKGSKPALTKRPRTSRSSSPRSTSSR